MFIFGQYSQTLQQYFTGCSSKWRKDLTNFSCAVFIVVHNWLFRALHLLLPSSVFVFFHFLLSSVFLSMLNTIRQQKHVWLGHMFIIMSCKK